MARLPGHGLTEQSGLRMPAPEHRPPKVMTVRGFHELGYLEAVNRLVLHPLGLALDVEVGPDGLEAFGVVWDCRDEPAGVVYPAGHAWTGHVQRISEEMDRRAKARGVELGFVIQEPPQ
jgi:hypothetical protein